MRRLIIPAALIAILSTTAAAHADPITYQLNGTFFPLTQNGPFGSIAGEITLSTDQNRIPADPLCTNQDCLLDVYLTVNHLVVVDDGHVLNFSAPQMLLGSLGENLGATPTVALGQVQDSLGNTLQLAFDIPSFFQGGPPTVCRLDCLEPSEVFIPSDNFSQAVFSADLTPVPAPEPSTLSLVGLGTLGLLAGVKHKFFAA